MPELRFEKGVWVWGSSYLAELLLDKGYIVHGLKRRASSYNHPRLEHIMDSRSTPISILLAWIGFCLLHPILVYKVD